MIIKLKYPLVKSKNEIIVIGDNLLKLKNTIPYDIKKMLYSIELGIKCESIEEIEQTDNCKKLFELLTKNRALVKSTEKYKETSLEKTYDFLNFHLGDIKKPFEFNDKIHIAIIGCGGIGANISMCLSSSGVKKFTLIDYDKIEVSNLNRQFPYDTLDIGLDKTHILKDKLLKLNSKLIINTHTKKIEKSRDLDILPDDVTLLVSAIDNPPVKSSLYTAEYALKSHTPIIFGSVGYDSISAGPLLTTPESIQNYLHKINMIDILETTPISGSIAPTNMLISSIIANNIISWLYSFAPVDLLNKRKIYDPSSLRVIENHSYIKD